PGFAGVVGFYGVLFTNPRMALPAPIDGVATFGCPVLGLFGGADQAIPPEQVMEFDAALGAAGVAHELVTYPDAPHSFFDRKATEYAVASADAWRRMLAFVGAPGAGTGSPA
ncbi:MAG TPA: dienelactone hydrolase family protein, partial [Candidatus Baltobacteraceae bacterium]|nr:dienelactone hydrolase family protein [Candidatus Baltobacteraceae bacterium]